MNTLRKTMRQRRLALDSRARRNSGVRAGRHLSRLPILHQNSLEVGVYLDAFGELPTLDIRRTLNRLGHTCYVPKIIKQRLYFGQAKGLIRHRFGMLEPAHAYLTPCRLDVCLVPLTVFNAKGGRIGMGGGFYDRAFERGGVYLIGCGYHWQEASFVANSWDVTLNAVVTDKEIRLF